MNKSKIFMIVSIITLVIAIIGSVGTYAWIVWNSSNTNIAGQTECFTINYVKGKNINNANVILFDESKIIKDNNITIKNGMAITNVIANINSNCTIPGDITISVTANNLNNAFISGNSIGAFKYALVKYNPYTYTDITTSELENISFEIIKNESITSTEKIELITEELSYARKGYMIVFYVDGDLANNDAANSTFSASIDAFVTQTQGELDPSTKQFTLISHITDLYTSNKDSDLVINNGIQYRYASIYDKDDDSTSSGGLMNDRQGSMSVGEDEGNIRYYGANPSNYIYFNCSDYSNQTDATCEKWRIIGIVDGKVKITRDSIIGNLAWDQNKNINNSLTTYTNNWEESSLQLMLNSSYYNGDTAGTITYYSGISAETATSLNMSSIGIKNQTTRDLISTSTWYLGGWYSSAIYANDIYNYERTESSDTIYENNPFSIKANIGIMYASDYGYATDFTKCTNNIQNYYGNCCNNDYLFQTSAGQWLLIPGSVDSKVAWRVSSSSPPGVVGFGNGVIYTYGVCPVLYLNSELGIEEGNLGTSEDPYRIVID